MNVEVMYDYQYYVKYELSAKYHLDEALQVSHQHKDKLSCMNMVAHCYYYLNDYFNALDYVLKAHQLDESKRNSDEYYYTLKLAGDIYNKLSIYDSAVYYYLEALKELGTSDVQRKQCDMLRHLANVYMEMHSTDLAMDYAVEALQLAELLHDERLIGDANLTLCQLAGQRKLYEKAHKYGVKSVEMYEAINDEKGLVLIYLEIASLYSKDNSNELSKRFYEKALMLSTEINYNSGIIFSNFLLGRLLYKEGHKRRALFILEEALAYSRRYNIQKYKVDLYYLLSEVYANAGDYELAYNSYKTGTELKEHMTADANKERIYRLQNDYNLYRKEQEINEYIEVNQNLVRRNEKLAKEVHMDVLTMLLNRRGMKRHVNHLKEGNHLLVLSDIDDFKGINDQYGHPCGDILLKEIANILKRMTPEGAYVARWGGEEFLFLLPNMSLEEGVIFTDQVRQEVATNRFCGQERCISITMTFGLAELTNDFEQSIHLADERLYDGKRQGKNLVIYKG